MAAKAGGFHRIGLLFDRDLLSKALNFPRQFGAGPKPSVIESQC
jgi:hypothetical protein